LLNAYIGDAVLRLVLIMHEDAPRVDSGTLHDWVTQYSTNAFLKDRYQELDTSSRLPRGLPRPTGNVREDATAMEAWIGRTFQEVGWDLHDTSELVLPVILDGVDPGHPRPRLTR